MFGFHSFAGAAISEQPSYIYVESASDSIPLLLDSVQGASNIPVTFSDIIALSDGAQNISSISVSFSDTIALSDIGVVYRYGDWDVIQTPTSIWNPVSTGASNVWTSIPSVS